MIPRQIIQTGRSRHLTGASRAAAVNMALLHPGWIFRFFDDADVQSFIDTEFPEYRSIFDSFPRKIQRFDFFRYLAIYRFGGFYFDLDVFLWESLDPLLDNESVFTFEELSISKHLREMHNMDWELGNYAFGAEARSPFIKAIIDNCVRARRDPSWVNPMLKGIPALFRNDIEVLNTTGPGLVTRTYAENPELVRQTKILFPDDVRDMTQWHHFGNYGIHLMEGSWRDSGSFVRRRLVNFWEARTRKRLMTESNRLGKDRLPSSDGGSITRKSPTGAL